MCVFVEFTCVCLRCGDISLSTHCGDPQRAGPHKAKVLFFVCGFVSTLKLG